MVTAVNANGSLNATAQATAITLPGSFTISSVTAGSGQAVVAWGTSAGASSYTVKYGTASGGPYGTIFTAAGTSPTTVTGLTNGTTYYMMVTAVNAGGSTNATSEVAVLPSQPNIVPIAPFTTIGMSTAYSVNIPFKLAGAPLMSCTTGMSVASSSNVALVPVVNVTFSGTYPNCIATIAGIANTSGTTNIALTATYGSASSSSTFSYTVLPSIAVAYGIRKIVGGYAGNAVTVRRSSDNATSNIGFTSAGDLDTVSLSTFCAATSCFVVTWYDQSGGANCQRRRD